LARVYADSLVAAAKEANEDPAEVVGELQSLIHDVFRAQPDAEKFLATLAVSRDRKAAAIREIMTGRASELFVHFLLVLNQHNRLDILREILAEAAGILDQNRNLVRVKVRSAVPLPDDQREHLQQSLGGLLARTPVLELSVDPALIGGLVVQVDDFLYDASVRSQLESLRIQLIEKGSHEIQSRRNQFGNY
jgi:F-type H+-transporting ATPase subunit delta